ncbi:hypothetical protein [Limosilactobacillus mucosae]|jgi:hypothetical protein|uniref:Uncharacterized protein n=1 Tax=Limosilactobacillus mucosae LM1 TaxID=1130798 RepID=A0A0D4CKE9_LIMMU|nr:hypothetical protein [Limosilactobacillus mucosae]AJT50627.1 hypothetical protein LBLM1_06020 [Limosilactobacillus mucosae LM1]
MKTTQAQRRATDTYRKKNPEKIRYQNTLGSARSFINPKTEKMKNNIKVATEDGHFNYLDDLKSLRELIDNRIKELEVNK